MSSLNRVQLIGYLGRDPETRVAQSGTGIVSFSVATTENYTNKAGEKVKNTEWHYITAFGKLADIMTKYLHKSDLVYIEGKLKTESWEKDGQRHSTTKIIADKMVMLGSPNKNNKENSDTETFLDKETYSYGTPDDDIPF